MRLKFLGLLTAILCCLSCEENLDNIDFTTDIIGNYNGIVTLRIGSNEALDVDGQAFIIEKIDNKNVRIVPVVYPDSSPVDSLVFQAELTPTPLGFINTEGVMLTFSSEEYADGRVNGTPFSLNSVQQDAHGKFDRDARELIFALEIVKNGVSDFEFFVGTRQ